VEAVVSLLKLICTDRNTHPTRALALIGWVPELRDDGTIDAATLGDESKYTVQSLGGTARWTKAGLERTTKVHPVETVMRADGGRTFILPACATCRRQVRLRDDRLGKLLRGLGDTPHRSTFDVSLWSMD
jgi:hypothetical protein